jgi:hypothetical protein
LLSFAISHCPTTDLAKTQFVNCIPNSKIDQPYTFALHVGLSAYAIGDQTMLRLLKLSRVAAALISDAVAATFFSSPPPDNSDEHRCLFFKLLVIA